MCVWNGISPWICTKMTEPQPAWPPWDWYEQCNTQCRLLYRFGLFAAVCLALLKALISVYQRELCKWVRQNVKEFSDQLVICLLGDKNKILIWKTIKMAEISKGHKFFSRSKHAPTLFYRFGLSSTSKLPARTQNLLLFAIGPRGTARWLSKVKDSFLICERLSTCLNLISDHWSDSENVIRFHRSIAIIWAKVHVNLI